jgi:hypothetical protein
MNRLISTLAGPALAAASLACLAVPSLAAQAAPQSSSAAAPSQAPSTSAKATGKENSEALPPDSGVARGKKLVLKDGSFQIIREYQVLGDRVRYYSIERSQWEEIPAALVDWTATAKAAKTEQKQAQALDQTVQHLQEEDNPQMPMDVDASLVIAPGLFLPSGEGMFVLEGKRVRLLDQVASQSKTDKKRFLERIMLPAPIVPNKQNIDIPGPHAKIRLSTSTPEFYLREAPPDPDDAASLRSSRMLDESGPEVELIRATVKGKNRRLESVNTLFGEQVSEKTNAIPVQTWPVAPNVYRFTLSQPLPPGEYALAEILPDGINMYVWDFGVDASPGAKRAEN